jgi:hypothetical protein
VSAVIQMHEQQELFTYKMRKPEGGAISLAHTREVPLPHEQTADLLKRDGLGEGSVVSFVGGTGIISGYRVKDGKVSWTVEVADLEVEL